MTTEAEHQTKMLMHALIEGRYTSAREALQSGVSMSARQVGFRNEPLHVAVSWGDAQMVGELLDHGAPVDGRDDQGRTPLHIAVLAGELKIAKTLIARGADVHAADDQGWTSLHLAATRRSGDIVQTLLDAGADLTATNEGKRPLELATALTGSGTALLLADPMMSFGEKMIQFAGLGNVHGVKHLLAQPHKDVDLDGAIAAAFSFTHRCATEKALLETYTSKWPENAWWEDCRKVVNLLADAGCRDASIVPPNAPEQGNVHIATWLKSVRNGPRKPELCNERCRGEMTFRELYKEQHRRWSTVRETLELGWQAERAMKEAALERQEPVAENRARRRL